MYSSKKFFQGGSRGLALKNTRCYWPFYTFALLRKVVLESMIKSAELPIYVCKTSTELNMEQILTAIFRKGE